MSSCSTTVAAEIATTSQTVLDSRDYRVFHRGNKYYLYDVDTGRLCELTAFAYECLDLCGRADWDTIDKEMSQKRNDWDLESAQSIIKDLREAGFFKRSAVDKAQQSHYLDVLFAHHPRRIQLLVAQMCNLKCLYCYEEHNGSNARRRLMSFEIAKASVDYLVRASHQRHQLQVTFFGGEPLLNLDVIKRVVQYCATIEQKSFVFELITNGTLLKPDVVDFLVANKFMLMISLDGYREMNNHNRPSVSGEDYFDRILTNAKHAQARYKAARLGPVKIRANLTHAHHDLVRTVRFLEDQGFTTIGTSVIDDLPWAEGQLNACNEQDRDEVSMQHASLLNEAITKTERHETLSPYESRILRQLLDTGWGKNVTYGIKCGVGRNTNVVDTDGKIYPCHRYGDLENYILGDIFSGLDKAKTMNYYRGINGSSFAKCQDCWVRYTCGGPCAWKVSNPNGSIHEPDERECNRIRRATEETLVARHRLEINRPELISPAQECGGGCGCATAENPSEGLAGALGKGE